MNFLENILGRLRQSPARIVMEELRPAGKVSVTAEEFLERISAARAFFDSAGLRKGDRCALLAPNSIAWAAVDLAATAQGIIVVPLYARQAPAELA
ncbi:MAG TPA: AMP-binding protein, partial [Candidatus Acidoferrales bacterium]